ncbi:hypothetical protein FCH79_19190 [Pseudomonas koreensis]|nr:hypothetical protein [Pseudomonas koreensis]PAW50419.1 hypothetical protein CKQ68_24135 [Pseudomonas moraviensis]
MPSGKRGRLYGDWGRAGRFEICGVWSGLIAGKPAPTGISGVHKICERPKSLWELACQRWGQ